MKKVGQFFVKMWRWMYPVAAKIEPIAATVAEVLDPKIAPAIMAGQAAAAGIAKEINH